MTADEIFACLWLSVLVLAALFGTLVNRPSRRPNYPCTWMPPKTTTYGERIADARRSNFHQ